MIEYLKTNGRVLFARAIGAAIILLVIGLIFGKLTEPYWFIGVFALTNIIMALKDWILARSKK